MRGDVSESSSGYFSLVFHAHLPFVRHPEHDEFLEERWFFEAMNETYLPLMVIFDRLVREGVDFRVTWSFTPTLLSMLGDELLRDRYQAYLEGLIELSEKELDRLALEPQQLETAEFYYDRLRLLREIYVDVCERDIVLHFRKLQDDGYVEVLTSAATHGFLPLLRRHPASVRAQVRTGVEVYRESFGRDPAGFWLPECGYYPGVDDVLAEMGIRFFFLESHGVLNGSRRAHYGVHAPIVCPSGVAAFGRDPDSSKQVWSAEEGFPGDPNYREFYRDIGYELPEDYIGKYIGPDGIRTQTGFLYKQWVGGLDRISLLKLE
ncbi:MAG: hypothetical protein AAF517_03120 [Planctomycetota bacterium]